MKAMSFARLERLLSDLPIDYGGCHGTPDCRHDSVLRDPGTGKQLCASCATAFCQVSKAVKVCIEEAVRQRCFFRAHPMPCGGNCGRFARRLCPHCQAPLCAYCHQHEDMPGLHLPGVPGSGKASGACTCLLHYRSGVGRARSKTMHMEVAP